MKPLKKLLFAALCCFGLSNAQAQTEVTFYTNMGNIEIQLTDTLTPVTVDSFLQRATRGFYDGLIFHRVIDNFMIQGGDPSGNGTGGTGTTIPDEFHDSLKNVPGALAMANRNAPNTGDCQFYINLVSNDHLNNKHTVFGMVTVGFDVVKDIGKVQVDPRTNKPITDVTLDSIRVKLPAHTAINNLESATSTVRIYPNPSDGSFQIELPAIPTHVAIVQLNGQVIFNTTAQGLIQVQLRNQPAGLYIVRISNEQGTSEQKLLVQ